MQLVPKQSFAQPTTPTRPWMKHSLQPFQRKLTKTISAPEKMLKKIRKKSFLTEFISEERSNCPETFLVFQSHSRLSSESTLEKGNTTSQGVGFRLMQNVLYMFLLLFRRFSPLDEILTWTENGCYTNTTVESTPVSQQNLNPVWHSDNPP